MRYCVKVIPKAKKEEVVEGEGENLKVKVRAPALEGRANQRLIEVLAKYFKVPKRSIRIVRGEKSREKIIEII